MLAGGRGTEEISSIKPYTLPGTVLFHWLESPKAHKGSKGKPSDFKPGARRSAKIYSRDEQKPKNSQPGRVWAMAFHESPPFDAFLPFLVRPGWHCLRKYCAFLCPDPWLAQERGGPCAGLSDWISFSVLFIDRMSVQETEMTLEDAISPVLNPYQLLTVSASLGLSPPP